MEYIIENITKKEMDILEDNDINWCPDDMFGENSDVVFFEKEEYEKGVILLGRTH